MLFKDENILELTEHDCNRRGTMIVSLVLNSLMAAAICTGIRTGENHCPLSLLTTMFFVCGGKKVLLLPC